MSVMKFKLPRQIISPELRKIIAREVRKQKLTDMRASKKTMREIVEVSKIIKKQGLPSYLIRKKLPYDLGYGLFLHPKADPILKGRVIAPYAGETYISPQNMSDDAVYAFAVVCDMNLNKEEQGFVDKKSRYNPRRLYSLTLDAEKKGNFTRYINHSEKPNVVAYLVSIPSNSLGLEPAPAEIVYFAKKTIQPGEQLLVSYEAGDDSYWSVLKIKPFAMTPKTFKLSSSLKLIKS